MGQLGTGTTMTFGTSGWAPEILSVNGPGLGNEAIENSHMGTPNDFKTYEPGKLAEPGEVSMSVKFNPTNAQNPPITNDPETITITFPDGSTHAAKGFLTAFTPTGAIEQQATADVTIKFTGAVTFA